MFPLNGAIIPLSPMVPSRTCFTAIAHYVSIGENMARLMHLPTAQGVPTKRAIALGPVEPNGAPYSERVEVIVS